MAISSLVLGILSIVLSFFSSFFWPSVLGLVLGILGIVLAAVARKNEQQKGVAIAGLVTSIIGIAFCIIIWMLAGCAACAIATSGISILS